MSNKLLSLLLLIIISLLGYFFYVYFFVYYDGVIAVSSNTGSYQVKLYAPKIGKTFLYECPLKKCKINEIAPLDYNLTILKEGYENHFTSFKLKKSEQKEININLKKKLSLESVEKKNREISKDDKIELLKIKTSAYAFFDMKEYGVYFFKKSLDQILLHYISPAGQLSSDLLSFNSVEKKDIDFQKVYGTDDVFLIQIGKEKYIYESLKKVLKKIELSIPILYAKAGIGDSYIITTEVGSYVFDFRLSELEYFSLFFDFVPLSEKRIIGIVKGDDETRLTNFGLDGKEGDIVFDFLRDTLEKNILLETNSSFEKIYKERNIIYVETGNGEIFSFDGL